MDYIGIREIQPVIQQLKQDGKHIYSISKLNTIADCEYEAGITYKKGCHGEDGIYGIMGTSVHDTLEAIMNDRATEADLLPALREELNELDMLGIEFPKDRKGEDSIRDRWVADMTDFCNSFVRPAGQFTTEEFFCYPFETENGSDSADRYLQGYIDLKQIHKDGSVSVWDWKTSSKFQPQDLIHHGRQLVGYTIAMEKQGYRVRRAGWIMLKYAEVAFMGLARANSKKETEIKKVVQRSRLIYELRPYLEYHMAQDKYDELTIGLTLDQAEQSNDWSIIPESVRNRYLIKPWVWVYPITDQTKREFWNYCNQMADKFETMSDDEAEWKHRSFFKTSKYGKRQEDTFRCTVLCNHRKTCEPLQEYFELKDAAPAADDQWDLF